MAQRNYKQAAPLALKPLTSPYTADKLTAL